MGLRNTYCIFTYRRSEYDILENISQLGEEQHGATEKNFLTMFFNHRAKAIIFFLSTINNKKAAKADNVQLKS